MIIKLNFASKVERFSVFFAKIRYKVWAHCAGLLCLYVAMFLSLAVGAWVLASSFSSLKAFDKRIALAERKLRRHVVTLPPKDAVDPLYIKHHLESATFLNREKKQLQMFLRYPHFQENEQLTARYAFLNGDEQRLVFSKNHQESKTKVLLQPVHVDVDDIKQLVCLVEGVDIPPFVAPKTRPALAFKSLYFKKNGCTYLLKMELKEQ